MLLKLADRLLLLKCYDRKMVKLPGCSFVVYPHVADQKKKKKKGSDLGKDWQRLNFNQNFSKRREKFATTDSSGFKIGKNLT